MNSVILAKRKDKPFDMAMDHIWLSMDSDYRVGKYLLVHFMNNSKLFGDNYICSQTITELDSVKSEILNNNFNIDWNIFDIAIKHLNGGVK